MFPQTQQATGSYTRTELSEASATRRIGGTSKRSFGQWNLGFNLAWELDFWGRYRRAIESADANLDASVDSYDAVLVTLLGDVATNYVNIRTFQQRIKYAKENVELQRGYLKKIDARYKAGTINKIDLDQLQSSLSQTEALIPQLEEQLRQANNQLCILLGKPPEDLGGRLGAGAIPSALPDVAVGIPADLLRRRPDVLRAERQAAAQNAQIGIAEADFYPRISLDGTLGYSAEHLNRLFTAQAFQGTFGPSFTWNLLNYGRILNNVRAQDAQFQGLVAGYQNAVLTAGAEVENGLVAFLKSQSRVGILMEGEKAARSAVELINTQDLKGQIIDINRKAVLEQNLVQQQDLLAQAQGDIALALIQIYRALGGSWQIRCAGMARSGANSVGQASPLTAVGGSESLRAP